MKEKLKAWLNGELSYCTKGKHVYGLLNENSSYRTRNFSWILGIVREHYISKKIHTERLKELGFEKTAALLHEKLPTTKKARSGEIGEIVCSEVVENHLGWEIPVKRLRWKDGREMALRGDDITAIKFSDKGELSFLKGESKSRANSVSSAIEDARNALDRDRGRPTKLSVLFVSERLREQGNNELALKMEEAVLRSFRYTKIDHLLFVLSGVNPSKALAQQYKNVLNKKKKQAVIGVFVRDHQSFIGSIYEKLLDE